MHSISTHHAPPAALLHSWSSPGTQKVHTDARLPKRRRRMHVHILFTTAPHCWAQPTQTHWLPPASCKYPIELGSDACVRQHWPQLKSVSGPEHPSNAPLLTPLLPPPLPRHHYHHHHTNWASALRALLTVQTALYCHCGPSPPSLLPVSAVPLASHASRHASGANGPRSKPHKNTLTHRSSWQHTTRHCHALAPKQTSSAAQRLPTTLLVVQLLPNNQGGA